MREVSDWSFADSNCCQDNNAPQQAAYVDLIRARDDEIACLEWNRRFPPVCSFAKIRSGDEQERTREQFSRD